MKKYKSVYELASELDAQGFVKDKSVSIPADESEDGDPDAASLTCDDGHLHSYPKYKAYYIIPK